MNRWRNVISVVEVIIMLVCVILLISHFAAQRNTVKDPINYTSKDMNGVIKENYALEYLNKYVDEILFSGFVNSKSEKYVEKEYNLVTPNIFTTLNNDDKLYLSLSYLKNSGALLTKENIDRKYNEYFNTKDIEYTDINKCAIYSFDKENELYTLVNDCMVDNNDKLMVYKKSYERNGQDGIATIYVGLKTDIGIFTDLDRINYYETDNINDFVINDDNCESFSKYTITFKEKDDSLYYFYSLTKA